MKISTYHNILGRHVNMVPRTLNKDFNEKVGQEMDKLMCTRDMFIQMASSGNAEWITAPEPVRTYYKTILKVLKEYRDKGLLTPANYQ